MKTANQRVQYSTVPSFVQSSRKILDCSLLAASPSKKPMHNHIVRLGHRTLAPIHSPTERTPNLFLFCAYCNLHRFPLLISAALHLPKPSLVRNLSPDTNDDFPPLLQ